MNKDILNYFEMIPEPRKNKGKMHKLNDIIIMCIYAILSDCKDATDIEYFLELRQEYFTNLLDLKHGTPSHDTISWVFRIIDPKEFMSVFIDWVKTIIEIRSNSNSDNKYRIIPIDGKAIKSATDKVNNGNIPYIVSAFCQDLGISIGQVKVDDKSNEITAIPDLLDLIDIENCIVTIDAIGTQKNIVDKIVNEKHAHYCLSVKNNQKSLFYDIDEYFKFALNNKSEIKNLKYYSSSNKDHGRIEKRECFVCNNIDFINDKDKWCNIKVIALVRNYREEYGKLSIEDRYYISDLDLSACDLSDIVRKHWSIENNLHWILDVHFREDLVLSKKDNAISNFSTIRKFCYNLTKLDENLSHLTIKRRLATYQYDIKHIENLLFSLFKQYS
jgi:predicted transposase YbfD/YdcC